MLFFRFFSFFLAQRKADLHVGAFIFTHSTQWPPQKAIKSHLFLSLDFFYKMPSQNKTKGSKKLLMAKKARIRACPEEEAIRTAMAGHLGHQAALAARSLKKRIWLAQVFFLPRRVTTIIKSGGNMSLELTESIVF
jgi:hypothetical protein